MNAFLFATLAVFAVFAAVAHVAASRAARADWGRPWVNRLDGLNRIFCRRWHRLRAEPLPLPATGPALVVANHVSGLDPLLMAAAANRPLRFIIAREQYERFYLRWFFDAIRCIPVDRTGRPEGAFRDAIRALKAGEVVAVFPHGTIHLDEDPPRKLKPGVARMARLAGCPVYPLRIQGVRGAGHTLHAVWMRSRATITTCEPVPCQELEPDACLRRLGRCIEAPSARAAASA